MPETNPSDDIFDLTDIVEEDGSPVADPGSGAAGADMSFERELEDLFSDAGPAPAAAKSPSPPLSPDDDPLELEEMDLSGIGLDATPSPEVETPRPAVADDDDTDAIDLSDFVDEEPGDDDLPEEPVETPRAAPPLEDEASNVVDVGSLDDLEAMEADQGFGAPAITRARDDDALPDLTGLGLEEDEALEVTAGQASPNISGPAADMAAMAATGLAVAAVAPPTPVPPGEGIDLEALDAIIAKAGGPPPVPSEEEAKAAAELLEAATARIAVLEDRIAGLEAELSGVTGQAGRHEAALEALAATPPPDAAALRTEFSGLLEERLEAFGQEMAKDVPAPVDVAPALAAVSSELKAYLEERLEAFGREMADTPPPPADVAPALSVLSTELKSFLEERLEAFGEDISARLANLPDPAAQAAAASDLRREILDEIGRQTAEATAESAESADSLRAEVSALKAELAAVAAQSPAEAGPSMDDVAALRQETADLAKALETLRGEMACRVTKVDQDALLTRIRMEMAAEMQAAIQKSVPAEAARIIREEIAALASEMDD
ncbi:hypothetical protein G3N56_07630 [Desulfovibrio sulfodismutans]|uniref:Uncharacterized protein n=1 Tax=Desulfolutivibrio sulfodismutans TaxID=63561 RepID=A0A7K3NKA9_9BACT|nr:hypothetical protein [Desulfolutivibrio sulfodismutans]NDY56612.1 hypothetical protein [Desulfolutivibrio sulfodismutans]QLA13069.1 hypothetical protein GD606_12730 [Desulfolutivibrio sulfodismutans DSM 3696]